MYQYKSTSVQFYTFYTCLAAGLSDFISPHASLQISLYWRQQTYGFISWVWILAPVLSREAIYAFKFVFQITQQEKKKKRLFACVLETEFEQDPTQHLCKRQREISVSRSNLFGFNNIIFFSGPRTRALGLYNQEYFTFNQRQTKQTLGSGAKRQHQYSAREPTQHIVLWW